MGVNNTWTRHVHLFSSGESCDLPLGPPVDVHLLQKLSPFLHANKFLDQACTMQPSS